jgi:cell division protein FtsB
MARWQPRTPKETLQASLSRLDHQIAAKEKDIKELKTQKTQVEQAVKALG